MKRRDLYDYFILIIEIATLIVAMIALVYTLPHATKDISFKINSLNNYLAEQQIQNRRLVGNESLNEGVESLNTMDIKGAYKNFLYASEKYASSDPASHSSGKTSELILEKEPMLTNSKTAEKAKKELIEEILKNPEYNQGFPKSAISELRTSLEKM